MAELARDVRRCSILGVNIGPGMVDLFEQLGFFRVFSAPVVHPAADPARRQHRRLHARPDARPVAQGATRQGRPGGALLRPSARTIALDSRTPTTPRPTSSRQVLRGRASGSARRQWIARQRCARRGRHVRHLYGDRNQYLKLATLFTHLGLILFLAGAAVTTALGYETVVFLGEGQTAPVQAVGTPDNLLVKNIHFEAPDATRRVLRRFPHRPRRLPQRPGGGAQDHPRQRPARGRRLRLPPEHVRPGRGPDDPRPDRPPRLGRPGAARRRAGRTTRRAS